ncbi:MAG: DUF6992 family protein [Bacteroidales bacterium]
MQNFSFLKKMAMVTFFLMVSAELLTAQDHVEFFERSSSINKSGMYLLGGWAIANLTLGTYGWINEKGSKMYFHQMNTAWNVVNLAIAGYAMWEMTGIDAAGMTADEMMKQHMRSENLYLINAGLDILYVAGGAWMLHASKSNEKRPDLLKGYGQSVMLQGTFLFLFDLTKFAIQYNHRMDFLNNTQMSISPMGLSLVIGL